MDPATAARLSERFDNWVNAESTCGAEVIGRDTWLATVKKTGVSFAVAAFQRAPGCTVTEKDINGNVVPASDITPWDYGPHPLAAVFERTKGGMWEMNSTTGQPFPCPLTGSPGINNPGLFGDVLKAWKMPYFSKHCQTATTIRES